MTPPGSRYAPGTAVVLEAQPAAGWEFERWEGDFNSIHNPVSITVNGDMAIVAVLVEYSGEGEVFCTPLGLSHYPYTSPVGYYAGFRSPAGYYDMTGKVWEWCNDWYDPEYYENSPSANPTGPASGLSGYFVAVAGAAWRFTAGRHYTISCRRRLRTGLSDFGLHGRHNGLSRHALTNQRSVDW